MRQRFLSFPPVRPKVPLQPAVKYSMIGSLLLRDSARCYSQPQEKIENYNEVIWCFKVLNRISFAVYVFVCLCM